MTLIGEIVNVKDEFGLFLWFPSSEDDHHVPELLDGDETALILVHLTEQLQPRKVQGYSSLSLYNYLVFVHIRPITLNLCMQLNSESQNSCPKSD